MLLLYARTRKQQVSFVEIVVQWDFGHTPSVQNRLLSVVTEESSSASRYSSQIREIPLGSLSLLRKTALAVILLHGKYLIHSVRTVQSLACFLRVNSVQIKTLLAIERFENASSPGARIGWINQTACYQSNKNEAK